VSVRDVSSRVVSDWDIVLRIPGAKLYTLAASPDGYLFAGGPNAILRARADSVRRWATLLEFPDPAPDQVLPLSRDTVLARTTAGGALFRWDSGGGWRHVPTPVDDWGGERPPLLLSMWGRGPADVYVVGQLGVILHFNGQSWERQSIAGAERATFQAVGGDDTHVYIAGVGKVWSRSGAGWDPVPTGGGEADSMRYTTIMHQGGSLLAGGYNRRPALVRWRSGAWHSLSPAVRVFGDEVFGGGLQQNGQGLVWNYAGDVALIDGPKVAVYRFPRFSELAGAVVVGGYLYVGGAIRGDAVVARIPR
jgi:hypothetical protein